MSESGQGGGSDSKFELNSYGFGDDGFSILARMNEPLYIRLDYCFGPCKIQAYDHKSENKTMSNHLCIV